MTLFCGNHELELGERIAAGASGKHFQSPCVRLTTCDTGAVFLASDATKTHRKLVVKMSDVGSNNRSIDHEHRVLLQLRGIAGIPQPVWFGSESGRNVLVLNYLGPSLEDVFNACGHTFSLGTVCGIGDQLVRSPSSQTLTLTIDGRSAVQPYSLPISKLFTPAISSMATSSPTTSSLEMMIPRIPYTLSTSVSLTAIGTHARTSTSHSMQTYRSLGLRPSHPSTAASGGNSVVETTWSRSHIYYCTCCVDRYHGLMGPPFARAPFWR